MSLSFVLSLLATCVLSGVQTIAQTSVSLQEELSFLKEKLEKHLTHSVKAGERAAIGNTVLEAMSFERCRIGWKISSEFRDNHDMPTGIGDIKISNQVSVDLSAIDPAKTKIYVVEGMKRRDISRSLVLELKTRPRTRGFMLQMVTTRGGLVTRVPAIEERQYAFFFDLNDQLVVEKISKAFHEASNICRSSMRRQ